MTDDDWLDAIRAFAERRLDEAAFHDRFFEIWNWHSTRHFPQPIPRAIEQLFFTVEAYCPDPALRDPKSLYETDDAQLRRDAETAYARLNAELLSRKLT